MRELMIGAADKDCQDESHGGQGDVDHGEARSGEREETGSDGDETSRRKIDPSTAPADAPSPG
jgi:hypothetical protein